MNSDFIPFERTGYFSELICDYIDKKEGLKPFYNRFFNIENFGEQLTEKADRFSAADREVLYQALMEQYGKVDTSKKTQDHIKQLKEPITFTITTGHQLNLFTGPLYFLFKIASTIKLCKELKQRYPKFNFVPVYWMATEDHDFDEINHFNFKGKKLQWNKTASGAVGKLNTTGLNEVYRAFSNELGPGKNADFLKDLFSKAYLENDTLTEATRFLANTLFKSEGLVIIDGDHPHLKRLLMPFAKKDIFDSLGFSSVNASIEALRKLPGSYTVQVNPREINYFYLADGVRERIIADKDGFVVNDTDITFTKEELLLEMETNPERFSPNVIARPLYQEVILPNLCYIGGGGEIAYWLELKAMFDAMEVPFPILLLRNSAVLVSKKQALKAEKLNVALEDLFLKQHRLINKKIREISNIDIDFTPQKEHLETQFKALYDLATKTDPSFLGAVKAQEAKQKKGLDKLEKRLLKAQKRTLKDQVVRITDLQNQLFPNRSLQERTQNFSELYLALGDALVPSLMEVFEPLKSEFAILRYDSL